MIKDLKYAIRMLVKNPGFTVVAALTLALGIGANTAIFTVVNAILLKPLPFPEPGRIVLVNENNLSKGWSTFSVSPPNFLDWRAQNQSFQRIAAFGTGSFNYTGGESPERLRGLRGTEGFLEILGGQPMTGRGFLAEEYQKGKDHVAILNYGFWQRAFASDPAVLGKTILLNGEGYTVVGVMHPGFRFGGEVALFTPRAFDADELKWRGAHYLNVIAQLKPGVTVKQADTEMSMLAERLAHQYPNSNSGWGATVESLQEAVAGDVRPQLIVLLGAVLFVLLIACANVANMLLARASVRSKEIAIRAAIGAGHGRLVRQLLTESVLLAALGGRFGLLLAYWGTRSLLAVNPGALPRTQDIHVDLTIVGFALALSGLTGIVFGLVPALTTLRSVLTEALKEGSRGSSQSVLGHRLRGLLVVTQVALALVLLIGSGLFLRSFARLQAVNPGFRTDSALSMTVILPQKRYETPQKAAAFFPYPDRITESGVASVE